LKDEFCRECRTERGTHGKIHPPFRFHPKITEKITVGSFRTFERWVI
jgi:hypothetical protein